MQNSSNNPVLRDSVFSGTSFQSQSGAVATQMTVQGTMAKTAFLLLAVMLSAAYTWKLALDDPGKAMPWMVGGGLAGFIVAMVVSLPKLAPSLAVPYASWRASSWGPSPRSSPRASRPTPASGAASSSRPWC